MEEIEVSEPELYFKPSFFLRCHSRQKDDRGDIKTKVWGCSFEPDPLSPEKTTDLVATCGANSVCLTNVKTGVVVNKYIADDANEDFYSAVWSTLKMKQDNDCWKSNILAVAGRGLTIHFIHPENKVCFHREPFKRQSHKGVAIVSLLFHPLDSSILIVSFSDGRVLVLNIGRPSPPKYETSMEELYSLHTPDHEMIILTYSRKCEIVLAATDDGLFAWKLGPKEIKNSGNSELKRWKFTFPLKAQYGKKQLIDSVEALQNGGMIATKCALYGEIYIWNLEKAKQSDEENIVVIPDHTFRFSNTDNYFMAMGSHPTSGLLCCGDDKGRLWVYNIHNIPLGDQILNPTIICPWPNVTDKGAESKRKLNLDVYDIVVNNVTMNGTGKYIVAVTSTNLVCIWKKA